MLMILGDEAQMCEESINTLIEKDESHAKEALIDCYFTLQASLPNNRKVFIKDYNMRWLTDLLKRNNKEALLVYYEQAKELMTLPDMVSEPAVPETTEAIRNIESMDCISVLIDLLKLSYDPNFKDREYFGLKDSCWNAIVAIGKVDYDITHDALSAARTDEKTTVNTAILDLIDTIEHNLPYILDKPMNFETAVQVIPR